jgi:hypothetical protein
MRKICQWNISLCDLEQVLTLSSFEEVQVAKDFVSKSRLSMSKNLFSRSLFSPIHIQSVGPSFLEERRSLMVISIKFLSPRISYLFGAMP